ncbi:uracil-DNA glycosylase family protein [Marinobacterium arenosum]|uniref:uracil-DNA glycosylase family protein n=1 Tax=Marinobacterium arenosum TaxID=2862496 RepID=UPI001C94A71A|nr:uracil-DNA glycosylase family protein [Marinobacterium arenosum]MBY4676294.1 uracil-DNA glycosylase family protein [Marinobacterium arenosum]
MSDTGITPLLQRVRQCDLCRQQLPQPPRPVLQLDPRARLLIIGQAPGRLAHQSGIPFNDSSGDRLRDWLGLDRQQFYHSGLVAVLPMGFCYPGRGRSGDLPPRTECAPQWHPPLIEALPDCQLWLLVGRYAQDYYLADKRSLTERVRDQQPDARQFCLPHPSPRNRFWLQRNPWFEQQQLPALRQRVAELLD